MLIKRNTSRDFKYILNYHINLIWNCCFLSLSHKFSVEREELNCSKTAFFKWVCHAIDKNYEVEIFAMLCAYILPQISSKFSFVELDEIPIFSFVTSYSLAIFPLDMFDLISFSKKKKKRKMKELECLIKSSLQKRVTAHI